MTYLSLRSTDPLAENATGGYKPAMNGACVPGAMVPFMSGTGAVESLGNGDGAGISACAQTPPIIPVDKAADIRSTRRARRECDLAVGFAERIRVCLACGLPQIT